MKLEFTQKLRSIWPEFLLQPGDRHPNPYYTFVNYRRIWAMVIITLAASALVPLLVVTAIHFQLIRKSVDSEFVLRTERLTSNARRGVTFFLEERLSALKFTVNEIGYDRLANFRHLGEVLRNLKLGFGGLSDLSVIDHAGTQIAYAGPFNLEGKDYSGQRWFVECREQNFYVSDIFLGYRGVPHIIIAVKSIRPDGRFFILRATLDTERLIQTLASYKSGGHVDIFLTNRQGILQTPSIHYGDKFEKLRLPFPEYSPRTRAVLLRDSQNRRVLMGYAFISTQIVDTPFVLMVTKDKAGMMAVWKKLRSNINWFVGISIFAILIVITITATFLVNKLYLTDRAKAETMVLMEQNNQLASIGQLAAGVAHEINNPLALINETAGYTKDLFLIKQQYEHDEELLENIESILDAVKRCARITHQLLGFARKFDVSVQKIDLGELVNNVLDLHQKEAEYRNITVNVDVSDDTPEIISDRGKLQQILVNLINNAFHAVSDGCQLDIRIDNLLSGKVRIAIRDDGCGISEEEINKIFEPFFTTKSAEKGSGLGLYITYGLVTKLGGDITVQSKQHQGTTFTITLPIRLKEEIGIEGPIGRR